MLPERDITRGVLISGPSEARDMKKLLVITAAILLGTSFTANAAVIKRTHHGYKTHHATYYGAYGMMHGRPPFWGNAAMSGNNGNSAYGNNSLGHIQGGNIGGGK